jgi:hypothetical protein
MFAYAGTYTADGEKVVHLADISWNQSWTGTDLERFYKLNDNTLTIKTTPSRSPIDGGKVVDSSVEKSTAGTLKPFRSMQQSSLNR